MKKTILFLFTSLFLLPSCISRHCDESKNTQSEACSPLINLTQSTRVIRTLITQDKIGELLEDHDPEQLSLLLDNISPAQMAFEAEVLSSTAPMALVYYYKESAESKQFIPQLEELAIAYENKIKCVIVDADQLFSLVLDTDIENLPALLLFKNGEIVEHIQSAITIDQLEELLQKFIEHPA